VIAGRAMYIWNLHASLNHGTVAGLVAKAQQAKLSSLWVKIGDGANPYENIQGNNANDLTDLVGRCGAENISVLGYHVPHCPTPQAVQEEVAFVLTTIKNFNLAGVVVDNEDGPGFFIGNSQMATAYGQALRTATRNANKICVMSSNDIISAHPGSYAVEIGGYVDLNAPQVYYGQSPSVRSRLNRAINENKAIQAPFYPVGAAFMRNPADTDGGFVDPIQCAEWGAIFIELVSQLHQADPNKYPGYAFWVWQDAPVQFWDMLNSTDVFVAAAASGPLVVRVEETSVRPLADILRTYDRRADCVTITGIATPDLNFPGNTLIVVDEKRFYSVRNSDIVDRETIGGPESRVWVRKGGKAWQSGAISIGGSFKLRETLVGMEDLPEPPSTEIPGMPAEASELHRQKLQSLAPPNTIAVVAAAYSGRCTGGDHYANNCAHFLSDAFLRAGFNELAAGQSADHFVTARCGTSAKRPIRARDMWQWFQFKATDASTTLDRNTGLWVVFQLDEAVYWGGHVVIVDTNAWTYYGTGCHWDWKQYAYKW
jgi:hypothetical protein